MSRCRYGQAAAADVSALPTSVNDAVVSLNVTLRETVHEHVTHWRVYNIPQECAVWFADSFQ